MFAPSSALSNRPVNSALRPLDDVQLRYVLDLGLRELRYMVTCIVYARRRVVLV
jgi:hypothetical protein